MTTLANEYRPATFEDIGGQPQVTLVAREMVRRYRANEIYLPAGLLLTGPRGSGKTTLARVIAAALNCPTPTAGSEPCRECATCAAIRAQTSDAVLEIDGATSGGVDHVRELKRLVQLTHSGLYRVIIADECHAMSRDAFSALLKQLEEPPPRVLYVLVTTDFHAVPATIVSRCLVMSYREVDAATIVQRLAHICAVEGLDPEPGLLSLLAERARGGMRDAIMALEQMAITGDLTVARYYELWPGNLPAFALEFLAAADAGDAERGLRACRSAFRASRDIFQMLDAVLTVMRDQLTANRRNSHRLSKLITVLKLGWDLRVRVKTAQPSEAILIETYWYLCANELAPQQLTGGVFGAMAPEATAPALQPGPVDLVYAVPEPADMTASPWTPEPAPAYTAPARSVEDLLRDA